MGEGQDSKCVVSGPTPLPSSQLWDGNLCSQITAPRTLELCIRRRPHASQEQECSAYNWVRHWSQEPKAGKGHLMHSLFPFVSRPRNTVIFLPLRAWCPEALIQLTGGWARWGGGIPVNCWAGWETNSRQHLRVSIQEAELSLTGGEDTCTLGGGACTLGPAPGRRRLTVSTRSAKAHNLESGDKLGCRWVACSQQS